MAHRLSAFLRSLKSSKATPPATQHSPATPAGRHPDHPEQPPLRKVFILWLITRIVLLSIAGLAATYGPHYPGYTPSPLGPAVDAWNQGDCHFYLEIASIGYQPGYLSNCGWCPGFALLLKAFPITPHLLLNALLLNNLILLAALYASWRWLRLDLEEKEAWRALLLLMAFPSAYFLTAPLSETTFLLCSAGAFWAARTNRWALAGLLGGWAALTRFMGLLLLPALLLEKPGKKAIYLALIPLAQLGLCLHFQQKVGDFWAYYHMQRRLEPHISGWVRLAQHRPLDTTHWLGLSFAALSLIMLKLAWKRLRNSERLYCILSILMPLHHSLFVSQARLMLILIPLYKGLTEKLFPWFLTIFIALQLIATWLFALAHPAVIY